MKAKYTREWCKLILLLYLLDSTRAAIGQLSGPYSTVRPAKSKSLFFRALFQEKEV